MRRVLPLHEVARGGERMADLISVSGRRQVRKARPSQFTMAKRSAFLDTLALTCNVSRAAAFADIWPSSVYRIRREDAAFAAQWQAALEIGYDRLEALALEHSGAGAPIEPDPERAAEAGAEPTPFNFEKALKLLTLHRAARQGQRQPRKGGAPKKNMTREETNAALMKLLDAAEKRVANARLRDA